MMQERKKCGAERLGDELISVPASLTIIIKPLLDHSTVNTLAAQVRIAKQREKKSNFPPPHLSFYYFHVVPCFPLLGHALNWTGEHVRMKIIKYIFSYRKDCLVGFFLRKKYVLS